jgi:hypothetical protein
MAQKDYPVDYSKIHTLLEDCAKKVFDAAIKEGDFFESLEFTVTLGSESGGFENVIVHKTKKGFFETEVQ